jgi:hypothetical protein
MTNVIKCLTKVTLIDNFQYQNQYVDIIKLDQRKNVQITDTNVYTSTIQDILFIWKSKLLETIQSFTSLYPKKQVIWGWITSGMILFRK